MKSKNWESEIFEFKRGIFQGDNYSPIIFLVVFNPLIDYIKQFTDTHGYQIGDTKVITKPFADDFEIITNNKRKHQKLQDDIQDKCQSLGLVWKPSKCKWKTCKQYIFPLATMPFTLPGMDLIGQDLDYLRREQTYTPYTISTKVT